MITEAFPYRLAMTSPGSPIQWQGQNAAGEWAYLRCRHGRVQIGFAPTIEQAIDLTVTSRGYYCRVRRDVDDFAEMLPHYRAALAMLELGARYV